MIVKDTSQGEKICTEPLEDFVFLIIFVLFILIVPDGYATGAGAG
jgi:hypothetical protein